MRIYSMPGYCNRGTYHGGLLLPDHPPKVGGGAVEGSLGADELLVRLAALDVVGVDVVVLRRSEHNARRLETCLTNEHSEGGVTYHIFVPITVGIGRERRAHCIGRLEGAHRSEFVDYARDALLQRRLEPFTDRRRHLLTLGTGGLWRGRRLLGRATWRAFLDRHRFVELRFGRHDGGVVDDGVGGVDEQIL